ncbi:gastric triacylglycerol lipase, putative, partial [Ixodes scapularis]
GLIKKWGYPAERHHVTTEDGYILEIDRIPHGLSETGQGQTRTPVLCVHGVISSAADYVMNNPLESPGDVATDTASWLSPATTALQTKRSMRARAELGACHYTFDKIGRYDLAAAIDYIISQTGFGEISLLTWSQGFTVTLVLLSTRLAYNDKVNLVVGMAPVADITHIQTPLTLLAPFAEPIANFIDIFTKGGLLTSSQLTQTVIGAACNNVFRGLCFLPINIVVGASQEQLNTTRIPVYIAHMPAGTSTQNIVHYAQMYKAKNFIMYDYGKERNRDMYGQDTPPEYPLEEIGTSIALFSGQGDRFADPKDVQSLRSRLQSIVFDYQLPQKNFNHLGFVIGDDATLMLHKPIIELIQGYNTDNVA